MTEFYDELETRDPEAREAALFAALPAHIAAAKSNAPGYARHLAKLDPASVTDRAALAGLPVLRKSDLIERQTPDDPLAGFSARSAGAMKRLYLSPGPIADCEGAGADWWRIARAMHAAGFRAGDIQHNCFAYHHTPAGLMFETAGHAIGCAVFPGGVGQTEAQVQAIAHFQADGYTGTPDFLKIILDKADEIGSSLASLKKACVSGGPLFPSLRAEYAARGIAVLQCYGTADLGLIAYESPALDGMILDESVIVEIVRPGTGDPVADGEVGEVVVTSLNPDYPMIRLATGDLSAMLSGPSPCGRTAPRIKGWMGRADQSTKVRGQFVRPEQVAAILARHGEVGRARLTVSDGDGGDTMTLACEFEGSAPDGLAAAIAETMRAVTKLRGAVDLVAPDSLANDGKVIDDARSYE